MTGGKVEKMKYIVMVKVYIIKAGNRDYTYEEYSGIEHDTIDEAYDEAQRNMLSEWYIGEK